MLEFHKGRYSDLCFYIDILYRYYLLDIKDIICINNVTADLQSNPKLFAEGTSLFTIINDPNATVKQHCVDLDKIEEWNFQWKMFQSVSILTQLNKHKKLFLLVKRFTQKRCASTNFL